MADVKIWSLGCDLSKRIKKRAGLLKTGILVLFWMVETSNVSAYGNQFNSNQIKGVALIKDVDLKDPIFSLYPRNKKYF